MRTKKEFISQLPASTPHSRKEVLWRRYQGRQSKPRGRPVVQTLPLSPDEQCVRDYGLCLADPAGAPPACIPDFPSYPSSKEKWWAKGELAIGTAGVGFIVANTSFHQATSEGTNTTQQIYASNAAYVGSTINTDASTTGVNPYATNMPMTRATLDFENAYQVRVVSWGIDVAYTGTDLNKSGRTYCLCEPDHQQLSGRNLAYLQRYNQVKNVPCTRQRVSSNYVPIRPFEMVYHEGATVNSTYYNAIMVSGEPGNTYEFRVFYNVELIGQSVRSKTENASDPTLTQAMVSLYSKIPPQIRETAGDVLRAAGPKVIKYLKEKGVTAAATFIKEAAARSAPLLL